MTASPEYSRRWRAEHPGYKGPAYLQRHDQSYKNSPRACKQCGASFTPRVHNQAHCSRRCKQAYAAARYEPTRVESKRVTERQRYQVMTYGKVMSDPLLMDKDKYARARAAGYRSGLEVMVATHLKEQGVEFGYETITIPFAQPAKPRKYKPDVVLLGRGFIVELKGRLVTADRQKHLLIQEQHPEIEIRFVFSNPQTRISKQSKTTYAMWCQSHGFKYAKSTKAEPIPAAWLREPCNTRSLAAIQRLFREV